MSLQKSEDTYFIVVVALSVIVFIATGIVATAYEEVTNKHISKEFIYFKGASK